MCCEFGLKQLRRNVINWYYGSIIRLTVGLPTLSVMSILSSTKGGEESQLGLSNLSVSPSSTLKQSESNGNPANDGEKVQHDPDNTSPHTGPKQGFLSSKLLGSKRKQMIVFSTVMVMLTVSMAILPAVLCINVVVRPFHKCIH